MEFKNGDMIKVVDKHGSYSGKHYGRTGVVERYTDNHNSVPVRLDGVFNKSSSYGIFYFKKKELEKHNADEITFNINKINFIQELKIDNGVLFAKVGDSYIRLLDENCYLDGSNHYFDSKINNYKENEYMRTIKIVDLWLENKKEELTKEKDIAILNAKSSDVNMIEIEKLVSLIAQLKYQTDTADIFENKKNALLHKVMSDNSYPYDVAMNIKNIEDTYNSDVCELLKLKKEILVMVEACETYEQEIAVLRSYDVVDENGVLKR